MFTGRVYRCSISVFIMFTIELLLVNYKQIHFYNRFIIYMVIESLQTGDKMERYE